MHELSLATGLVDMVEAASRREHFRRVAYLRLEVGALAGVEPQALRFALGAVVPGTCLAEADISLEEPPGRAECSTCGGTVEIANRAEPCYLCGAFGLRVTGGGELRIVELIVHDDG